eukprot:TRINITY_DN41970_c0_g1_i1.p1 TRINITY_DN41970_c0_g1~~TRINITY_DN41970_c0_g1_i1.p1  ORF type:complete len:167 (+),score=53.25 TRINITY_DN41970_c0_g1_i1:31-501(+)
MDPDNISAELTSTCNAVENLLTDAKQKSEDLSNFVENQLGPSFGPAIGIYVKLFKSLKVKSRDELEEKVKSNFRHASVQDSFENLLTVESAWNTFLSAVDAKLQGPALAPAVTAGGSVKVARELTNARTGEVTSLSSLLSTPGQDYVHLVLLRHFA